MLYSLFKKIAFKFDPELIHAVTFNMFHFFPLPFALLFPRAKKDKKYHFSLKCGLNFPYPVGVAAGLDKDCLAFSYFNKVGFGTVEGGTVTPYPQPGNPRPRIFRYIKEESLRNSMGFPNLGMEEIYLRLKEQKLDYPIGINIGKNKDTPKEFAYHDYELLSNKFQDVVDYLVVNVSSPNTPGLRQFQETDSLKKILDNLNYSKPVFLKIAPDLNPDEVFNIYNIATSYKLSGIVATNTSIDTNRGEGGISGRLLYQKSKKVRDQLLDLSKDTNFDIIGSGGFYNFEEVLDFWKKGGRLLQIYSSFIFKGPRLLKEIQKGIDKFKQPLETLFENPELFEK